MRRGFVVETGAGLYVVTNCNTEPKLTSIKDPARLDWQEVAKVQHYALGQNDQLMLLNHPSFKDFGFLSLDVS